MNRKTARGPSKTGAPKNIHRRYPGSLPGRPKVAKGCQVRRLPEHRWCIFVPPRNSVVETKLVFSLSLHDYELPLQNSARRLQPNFNTSKQNNKVQCAISSTGIWGLTVLGQLPGVPGLAPRTPIPAGGCHRVWANSLAGRRRSPSRNQFHASKTSPSTQFVPPPPSLTP